MNYLSRVLRLNKHDIFKLLKKQKVDEEGKAKSPESLNFTDFVSFDVKTLLVIEGEFYAN